MFVATILVTLAVLPAGATPAAAPADDVGSDVARGWYLWRTGQEPAARTLAAELAAAHPDALEVHRLHTALEVAAGDGASVEAAYREWWGEAPNDPVRRTALALVLSWRHAAAGGWCDEVTELIAKVGTGEAHYWATLADRQRELRCTGQTGHADAELRRIQTTGGAAEGFGWADGVLARLDAKYIKDDLPADLERVWTDAPHRLDRAGVLWVDGVSGPGKAAARRVANQALDRALAGSDPVVVHAALYAYTTAADDKGVAAATERLRALDPAADPSVIRSVDDVRDPPVYDQIDRCAEAPLAADGLSCIGALTVPESGAIAAYAHYVRRLLAESVGRADEAYAEARAAHLAEPTHRFHARTFARLALGRSEDLQAAAMAMDEVLRDRTSTRIAGAAPTGASPEQAAAFASASARDYELRGRLLRKTGDGGRALSDLRLAQTLGPTPVRTLLVGLALADIDHRDEAALALAYGMRTAVDDTAVVAEARATLGTLSAGWLAGRSGPQDMIDAAARVPGAEDRGPPSSLIGKPWPDPALLPTAPADAKTPGIRVVATWASWVPASVAALERWSGIGGKYRDQGVTVVALAVDADPRQWHHQLHQVLATLGVARRCAEVDGGLVAWAAIVELLDALVVDLVLADPGPWPTAALREAVERALDGARGDPTPPSVAHVPIGSIRDLAALAPR
ncbi:MAG: hypothetical protein ABMB14_25615, partial [Myxococcota bacterium]